MTSQLFDIKAEREGDDIGKVRRSERAKAHHRNSSEIYSLGFSRVPEIAK
jgi:hypothetical protein